MKSRSRSKLLILTLALALVASGCSGTDKTASLQASGVIEATEVVISPELGGRITEISVDEGESVARGDVLFQLDDTLLQAQRQVVAATLDSAHAAEGAAQAGIESARVQYELALTAAQAADRQNRITDWRIPAPGRFDQPSWYFTQDEQIAAAQTEVEAAETALDEARNNLTLVLQDASSADFLEVEKRLANTRAAYLVARDVYARSQVSSDDEVTDAAKSIYDDSKDELDRVQQEYDDLLTTQAAKDVLKARAELSVARERYNAALDHMRSLQTGELSPNVTAAQTAVRQAEAALRQAQTAVSQAEAQLALIDAQIEKLTVRAPVDGVVLVRSIEPGEVIQPGLAAMTVAPLEELTVTVYIPEDRYGQINLGDPATLTVDSFPEETFDAVVTRIADKAEYTPRNVQTKEERQTTVYAIKLSLTNPGGKLKPGMPVDVSFGE
ncbi:MAG: HlyD family efflux transporter periplasmic adaptor subunit [Chloroflexi bacterium]|nr:HlyD family efflux transporter periplasmic adaptor subunit [Chloroflexota bacterium]